MRARERVLAPALVAIIGLTATAIVAGATSMSAADAFELTAIAAGTALVGVLAGAIVLRGLRRHTLGTQIAALALSMIAALIAGAYAAARAMFLSAHDLSVLTIVLLAAGTVGIAGAFVLGGRVGATSRSLVDVARRIGGEEQGDDRVQLPGPVPAHASQELANLANELRQMEARLDEARRRERTLEASRRELVAWVSHDLRTPLAGIRAMVEALEDGVVDDPATVTRYHRTLREQADQLATLVDDLFELSRTQAGALRLHFERVSLGDLVSDALASSAPLAEAKGVRLVGSLVGPPPELDVSTPELLRALRNLLENAIRHTPSDGSVVVEAGVDDSEPGCVYVSVLDSGGGVPEADLEHIFDVAFQSDPARTPGAGAGLGLAIARGFVEAHQGRLVAVNQNGGARFTLRVPIGPTPLQDA